MKALLTHAAAKARIVLKGLRKILVSNSYATKKIEVNYYTKYNFLSNLMGMGRLIQEALSYPQNPCLYRTNFAYFSGWDKGESYQSFHNLNTW